MQQQFEIGKQYTTKTAFGELAIKILSRYDDNNYVVELVKNTAKYVIGWPASSQQPMPSSFRYGLFYVSDTLTYDILYKLNSGIVYWLDDSRVRGFCAAPNNLVSEEYARTVAPIKFKFLIDTQRCTLSDSNDSNFLLIKFVKYVANIWCDLEERLGYIDCRSTI